MGRAVRQRHLAVVAVVAALALSCAAPAAAQSTTLRFVSLNIANGAGYVTAADRARQNSLLASLSPDVVGLQEVDVGVPRSGGGNTASLDTATMPGTVLFARCAAVDTNANLASSGVGSVGVALWVRAGLSVVDYWTVPISYADTASGGDGWPRCALVAHITGGGHDFSVAVTHLMTGDTDRAILVRGRSLRETVAYGVDVLLGDMNDHVTENVPNLPKYTHCSSAGFAGCIDQAWTMHTCTGRLVPTHGASDHPYAALADVDGL